MAADFRINIYGQLDPKTRTNIQAQLKNMSGQLKVDIKSNTDFSQINDNIKKSTKNTKDLDKGFKNVNTTTNKMTQDFKTGFVYEMGVAIQRTIEWTIAVGGLYSVIRKVQDSIQFVKDIDVELTTIAMVTGQTREQVQGLAQDYVALSKELKANTLDVTKSAVALYRQGLNAEEVEERLRQISMAAKVAGISVEEATTFVTVGVNAMKVSSQEFNDVLVKVSSNAATNYEKIAKSFQKSAASFRNANVELEKATSYMATVQEVSQLSPETVGAAFKTIIARFSKVTQEGMDNSEVLNSIVKALHEVGINAIGADDQLRDLGSILDELSGKWETLEKKERDRLKTEIAGVRRGDIFLTLMDNYTRSLELYEVALDSNGETLQQYEKYTQSVAAAQEDLANTWKELASIMVESGQIQGFYNIMADLVELLISLENSFGLINVAILAATTALIKFKGAIILNIVTEFIAAIQLGIGALTSMAGAADLATISFAALKSVLMTVLPILALAGLLYGIKRLREYNEEIRVTKEEVEKLSPKIDDLKQSVDDLNATQEHLLRIGEDADFENLKTQLDELAQKYEDLGGLAALATLRQREQQLQSQEDIKFTNWMQGGGLGELPEKSPELIAVENQIKALEEAQSLLTVERLKEKKYKELGDYYTKQIESESDDMSDSADDAETVIGDEVKTLEQFYGIIRKIAESEYQMDLAEGTERESQAILYHISLLKEYNAQMNEEIQRLDSLVDVTDGISSAEVELIEKRDELIDKTRDNNLEIKSLTESYQELNDVFEENRDLAVEILERRKENLQESIDALDDRQEALKIEREEQEKILAIEESLLAVEKARAQLANVLKEKNTRVLTESGFEWVANPQAVRDARTQLQNAEKTHQEKLADYDEWRQDRRIEVEKEGLEQEISLIDNAIERIKNIESESYDERIEMLNNFIIRYKLAMQRIMPAETMATGIQPSTFQDVGVSNLNNEGSLPMTNGSNFDISKAAQNFKEFIQNNTYNLGGVTIKMSESATLQEVLDRVSLLAKTNA